MDKPGMSDDNIYKLVKLVERRPEIWDKMCNKDSEKKRQAWIEIFNKFDDRDWEEIPADEKKKLEDIYQGKWKNLRDTFMKSLKGTQQYKHHDILKFLMKNAEFKKQSSPVTGQAGPSNEPCTENELKRLLLRGPKLASKKKRMMIVPVQSSVPSEEESRQKSPPPETTHVPTSTVHSTTESHQQNDSVIDEDESSKHFFMSILPMIRNFSAAEKVDFSLAVLGVIKNIKDRSKMSNNSPSTLQTNFKDEVTVSDSD